MQKFDGLAAAAKMDALIASRVESLGDGYLLVIQIGEDRMSDIYIRSKTRICEKLGINFKVENILANLSDPEIENRTKDLLSNPKVKGAIIQLPLPRERLNTVLDMLPQGLDIDVLSHESQTLFRENRSKFSPPIVRAFEHFVSEYSLDLKKIRITMLGFGELIGVPLAYYLKKYTSNFEIIRGHIPQNTVASEFKFTGPYKRGDKLDTDLLILGTNTLNLVNGEDILANTYVVDFGTTLFNGKTTGNLDIASPLNHLAGVSTSPGGMGPLVVRCLLLNLLGL